MDSPQPHTIQEIIALSLAPVFLLVAIGSLLNVVTSRLGRVVDRARRLEERIQLDPKIAPAEATIGELKALDARMKHAQRAISFSAFSALIIAVLVAILFLSDLYSFDASQAIAILFVVAMAGIILSLMSFLWEISIATSTLRVRTELINRK